MIKNINIKLSTVFININQQIFDHICNKYENKFAD